MGAKATRLALADAGIDVEGRPVRLRRQLRGGQPRRGRELPRADRVSVHRRLQRLRHRRQRARPRRPTRSPRRLRPRRRGRHGQAPARRLRGRPGRLRRAELVRRDRPVPHAEVLRHEDQALHARPRHLPARPWPRWRRRTTATARSTRTRSAASRSARRRSSSRRWSTTRSRSTCSAPPTRAPPPSCCAGPTSRTAIPRRPSTCGPRSCGPGASAPSRCTARGSRSSGRTRPTVDASRAAYEIAGIGPEDVDVVQLQDTDAGAEVIHMAENGFCTDGEQETLLADGATEIGGRAPGQHGRRPDRQRRADRRVGLRQVHELVLQLRGRRGSARCPARRASATPAVRRARHGRGGHRLEVVRRRRRQPGRLRRRTAAS